MYKHYDSMKANRYEIMNEEEISFKMIHSDVNAVIRELDEMTKRPKKFMCLNDNINHSDYDNAMMIKKMMIDFYESLFPKPSQFELPSGELNAFLYVKDNSRLKREDHSKRVFLFLSVFALSMSALLLIIEVIILI